MCCYYNNPDRFQRCVLLLQKELEEEQEEQEEREEEEEDEDDAGRKGKETFLKISTSSLSLSLPTFLLRTSACAPAGRWRPF
ncbi:Uncharacterized protein APZ42_022904 [Daphnia magna]|uniref:Uncharacterized protein n=1 Tax=Daphnia magna TaxID=35525 RepID=A0A164VWY7_9CRUS|nr:Uncharacterized protein APZ42_022904 [Daphnia magna]